MAWSQGWQVTLALVLIAMTGLVYYVHYLIFRDPHHIMIYFIGDVAFVFFEVLLVTLIIHRGLHLRERAQRHDPALLPSTLHHSEPLPEPNLY